MEKKKVRKSADIRSTECALKLDRTQLVTDIDSKPNLPAGEFDVINDRFVSQQTTVRTYLRSRMLQSRHSGLKVFWQYGRQHQFLYASKVTLVSDDRRGLARTDFPLAFQNYLPILAEFAFDFGGATDVNQEFVERHAVFGKSRPHPERGGEGQLRYGGRNSDKLVRAYAKPNVEAYRIEVEMHSRLLRQTNVRTLSDLPGAARAIVPDHFMLVEINWDLLRTYLLRRFFSAGNRLIKSIKDRASIHSAMRYLRGHGVHNPHRFLEPIGQNALTRQAATTWVREFEGGAL